MILRYKLVIIPVPELYKNLNTLLIPDLHT